jgi:hypothetical protein
LSRGIGCFGAKILDFPYIPPILREKMIIDITGDLLYNSLTKDI